MIHTTSQHYLRKIPEKTSKTIFWSKKWHKLKSFLMQRPWKSGKSANGWHFDRSPIFVHNSKNIPVRHHFLIEKLYTHRQKHFDVRKCFSLYVYTVFFYTGAEPATSSVYCSANSLLYLYNSSLISSAFTISHILSVIFIRTIG